MSKIKVKKQFGKKNEDFAGEPSQEAQVQEDEWLEKVVPKWYDQFKDDSVPYEKPPEEEITSLKIEAQNVLDNETKFYNSKTNRPKKGSNGAWIHKMMTAGTFKDKLAANVIAVQNSPVHSLSLLTSLIHSVKASKKRECLLLMDILTDVFLQDLLRPGVKLKTFDRQPVTKLDELTSGCAKARRLRLCAWLFEEKLKGAYGEFIEALNQVGKDTVEANRIKSVAVLNKLLTNHPEQEQVLLQNIVNKLGDPSQKVVSKVIYSLTQMLRVHPSMKQIVLTEVEKLLFRLNMNSRTQYYCICFLSQFIFQDKDKDIARNIIQIYFSFFKAAVKKGEVESRLMGALLMGTKRAYPFAKLDPESMAKHVDTLYKLVHLTSFNVALHALCLLQEVSSSSDDRFYSALYRKLLDPNLSKSCHHAMFINLLYKAISKDSNIERVKAMIKRLLQLCLNFPVPLACALLYLISQLISKRRKLLFADTLIPENSADPENPQTTKFDDDEDDGDEHYVDVDKMNETDTNQEADDGEEDEKKPMRSWMYVDFNKTQQRRPTGYNPFVRNPAFANSDKTAYLELAALAEHFHPTVALFAKKILNREIIIYSGDPLVDFTLVRFLERFVFKNPKNLSKRNKEDDDDDEDKGPDPLLGSRKYYVPSGLKSVNVNSSMYLNRNEQDIPVDELFLYRYLKGKKTVPPREKHGDDDDDDDDDDNSSVNSEEFESVLNKMIGGKRDEDLDFMDAVSDSLKRKAKKMVPDVDDDDDDDVEEEEEEEEDEFDDDNEDDEDETDIEFDSDQGEYDGADIDVDKIMSGDPAPAAKKQKLLKKYKVGERMPKRGGINDLFAPAEEFAEMLEEAGTATGGKPGMHTSWSNKDNSAHKQLDWEKKRDRWVREGGEDKRKWTNKKFKSNKKFKK